MASTTEIELLSLDTIRTNGGRAEFVGPQRPRFHLLALVTAGSALHTIDFVNYAIGPGTVFWVRPGQVQQWGRIHDFEATVALFTPSSLDALTQQVLYGSAHSRQAVWSLGGADLETITAGMRHLVLEYGSTSASSLEIRAAILRHTLTAILLKLTDMGGQANTSTLGHSDVFERFHDAVEREFATVRSVSEYAERIGYSEKTVLRATRSAAGMTAKQYIDQRVVLEAKRLLSFGTDTVTQVASSLGFDDSANFTKFFATRAGLSPLAFRRQIRAR
ncbi:helix-turn-helix domain-containing protein [Rhodococcus sp. 27YEA15]|uniref:helix-turn-helix domain-containing protein n=1 Tax=Rhodococcus sp. 27YEA15 TaxID=3156259 RepID=UPI003C7B360D